MNINFEKNDKVLTVSLDGRLDTNTAPELEKLLNDKYEGIDFIIFDLEKLIYVSSAGLRVLLTAHKRMKGNMKFTSVTELVMEVFDMTGFSDIWVIE